MKTYRQREKQGTKVSPATKGPDETKIKELLDRTNYTLDVTTGQRKYGGPPPEAVYSGPQPTVGTEVKGLMAMEIPARGWEGFFTCFKTGCTLDDLLLLLPVSSAFLILQISNMFLILPSN